MTALQKIGYLLGEAVDSLKRGFKSILDLWVVVAFYAVIVVFMFVTSYIEAHWFHLDVMKMLHMTPRNSIDPLFVPGAVTLFALAIVGVVLFCSYLWTSVIISKWKELDSR